MIKIRNLKLSALQVLSIGFAFVILFGAVLLMLPVSNKSGEIIPFIDALFTSASASCVTGLVVFDTYSQFTAFGQVVILCLIQVGGLGFMAIALLFSMVLGKRIGLRERFLMAESIGALKIGGVVRLLKRLLIGTVFFELAGALLLCIRFCPKFGFFTGLWYSVFHSVSAFCNAGFDLMGRITPYSSLTTYAADPLVSIVIASLIIIGGIGFVVWDDLIDNKWHFQRYRLHTKIVLITTFVLIVVGAGLFLIFERNTAFSGMSDGERLLAAFFQSVTPRTAGYNTIDLTSLSEGGSALTILLMIIGASPGSTGGGIKTTTFFVIIFSVIAYVRKREGINVFQRRVDDDAVEKAYNATALYCVAALIGALIICTQGFSMENVFFEVASAIGTVGLTKGITPQLAAYSKVVVILLMYLGRMGSLSVAMAMSERRVRTKICNVREKIITG